jgi:hypothetical protein
MSGSPLSFPRAEPFGDLAYYIQRGATLQTYRALNQIFSSTDVPVAQPIDTLIAHPFPIGLGCTLDELAFNVTTLAAGSSARIGIYRATSSRNIYPGALVVETGAVATTSAGFKNTAVAANLTPGLYWAVYLAGVLAPTVSAGSAAANPPPILGWNNTPAALHSLRVAFAFAALPAAFPGGAALNAGVATRIWGRFSA